jgi:hypothetical protein
MSISKVSIISILLLITAVLGCSSKQADTEESMNMSANKLSQANQPGSMADINATEDLKLSNDMQKTPSDTHELLILEGQVLFQQMEGGFFGFIDKSGNKYTPIGMLKANLRHGLVVRLTGEILPNIITITQFGQVIKVESVVVIDDSNAQEPGRPNLSNNDL